MILKEINISNKFIKYENISFNFSKPGIYKISGPNGSGKTTIIEQIVFGNYNVTFQDESFYDIWVKDRFNLFTYIPQKIYEYNLTIGEYICKGNKKISLKDCKKLLNDFDLDESILKTKFNVLSGGEKKKIQIIAGVLKNTPYIFIDEPSNNLDNSSVEKLNKVLSDLSKDHVIVLVSHDERINININFEYIINGNSIYGQELSYSENINNSIIKPSKWNKDYILTILKTIKDFTQYFTIIFLSFIILFLLLYTSKYFDEHFLTQKYFNEETILIRNLNSYDSDLNDYYVEYEKLNINKEAQNKYINWENLYEDISKLEYVKDIYLIDEEYYNRLFNAIKNNTLIDEKIFISCPLEYYDTLYDYVSTVGAINLVDGSIPQDYQKEVSLSKNVLIKYYGYTEESVSNAIGNQIFIDEYDNYYTVVGFTYYDYINISYEKNHNNLIYHYEENTYADFVEKQFNYLYKVDGWFNRPSELAIVINSEKNEEFTNYVFTNYPCVEIISTSFSNITLKFANYKKFIIFLIVNIIITTIFSLALFFLNRSTIKYNYNVLEDFGIYYIDKSKILNFYKIFFISLMLIAIIILFIFNSIISKYAYYTNIYIIIDSLILLMPIVLYLLCYKGKRN